MLTPFPSSFSSFSSSSFSSWFRISFIREKFFSCCCFFFSLTHLILYLFPCMYFVFSLDSFLACSSLHDVLLSFQAFCRRWEEKKGQCFHMLSVFSAHLSCFLPVCASFSSTCFFLLVLSFLEHGSVLCSPSASLFLFPASLSQYFYYCFFLLSLTISSSHLMHFEEDCSVSFFSLLPDIFLYVTRVFFFSWLQYFSLFLLCLFFAPYLLLRS